MKGRESQSCGGEGGSRRLKGRPGHSGAGILFPLLESPELALDCKGGLLRLWRCQVNVDFFFLLGLFDAARFPCRQLQTHLDESIQAIPALPSKPQTQHSQSTFR